MINTKQVIELSNSVNYQAGSVVSKEVVKGKTGGVVLFIDGEAEVTISGKAYAPKA